MSPSYCREETLHANFIKDWASKHDDIECLKDAKEKRKTAKQYSDVTDLDPYTFGVSSFNSYSLHFFSINLLTN